MRRRCWGFAEPLHMATAVDGVVMVDRAGQTQTLLVYAAYDLTFPRDLSVVLVDEFKRRGLPHETVLLRCGHYSTGSIPFKFIDGFVLTRFLRGRL